MRLSQIVLAAASLALPAQGVASSSPSVLTMGAERTINGVEVACTGVGQTKLDPHWAEYPVRVELSNARDEYLTDGEIAVSDAKGTPVVAVRCEGPWILLKLKPGGYRVDAKLVDIPAKPRSASFQPPAKGQMRLVLKFADVEAAPAAAKPD